MLSQNFTVGSKAVKNCAVFAKVHRERVLPKVFDSITMSRDRMAFSEKSLKSERH